MSVFADFIIRFINLLILFVIVVNYIVTSKMLYNIGKKQNVYLTNYKTIDTKCFKMI